jgi:hypothetical protein
MYLSDEQLRAMHLAGTVSVPLIFPAVGRITAQRFSKDPASPVLLRVEDRVSPRVMISRTFFLSDVALIFVPDDCACVELSRGKWLWPDQAHEYLLSNKESPGEVLGIVHVLEKARTLMHVEVGMTAAESVDYYPPLPGERSKDHYDFQAGDCCDRRHPTI